MTTLLLLIATAALAAEPALAQSPRPSPFGPPVRPAQEAHAQGEDKPQAEEPPQTAQAEEPRPARRAADLFGAELREAKLLDAAWLAKQEALEEHLAESPACSQEAERLVSDTRDAALRAMAARTNYYEKHLNHLQQARRAAEERQIQRAPDRTEMEAGLGQARRELEAAERRRGELAEALDASRTQPDAAALETLDRLIAKLRQEVHLSDEGLKHFDEAQRYLLDLRRWARQQERHAQDQVELVRAESMLWRAYYDGRKFRQELRCYQSRPPLEEFRPRTPSSLGGIR